MNIKTAFIISIFTVSTFASATPAVTFKSNQSSVTALVGSTTGDFAKLQASDFAKPFSATEDAKTHYWNLPWGWVNPETWSGDKTARWVTMGDTSALYKIDFSTPTAFSNAVLNITYSVDDQLGSDVNAGLFIDGKAITNSTSPILWNSGVETKTFSLGSLSAGTHSLYFDVVNSGNGPSGVVFNGSVTEAVPEPASMAVLALGGLFFGRRKK